MKSILLVSEDDMLLRTRAALLLRTGAQILSAFPKDALDIQKHRVCDMILLCHSVPEEMCAALAETIHKLWPATKVMLVISEADWTHEQTKALVDAVIPPAPGKLLQLTSAFLEVDRSEIQSSRIQIPQPVHPLSAGES